MSARWSKEESALLDLLRAAMGKENKIEHKDANKIERKTDCDWERLLHLAESHAVTAMLYDVLEEQTGTAACIWERVQKSAQITVLSNYRLLFLTAYVTDYLGQYGIAAVTLKGAATAVLYPVPEYRKSGDVDLLIPLESEYKRALRLLQQAGFLADEEQLALHHTDLRNAEGISIELHHTLADPFENQKVNEYLKNILPEYGNHIVENTAWGVRLLQPADAYHAFYLIVHMLQHFLREGFVWKNSEYRKNERRNRSSRSKRQHGMNLSKILCRMFCRPESLAGRRQTGWWRCVQQDSRHMSKSFIIKCI